MIQFLTSKFGPVHNYSCCNAAVDAVQKHESFSGSHRRMDTRTCILSSEGERFAPDNFIK